MWRKEDELEREREKRHRGRGKGQGREGVITLPEKKESV